MKSRIRNMVMAMGVASALAAVPAFGQTTIIVDPAARPDPNAPVVILAPENTYVVTPDNVPAGEHYARDIYGRPIIVDDAYSSEPPQRRSMFDSSVDPVTGTVTLPNYMGPRDTSGQ